MKWIVAIFSALALAVLGSSVFAPMSATNAFASRMNGTATCGQMNCMQDRYYAATKGTKAKTQKKAH